MTKVPDASKADGSTGWFKIYENGWAAANKGAADNDLWGVKDMYVNRGYKMRRRSKTAHPYSKTKGIVTPLDDLC